MGGGWSREGERSIETVEVGSAECVLNHVYL